jgi:hypothetical protein
MRALLYFVLFILIASAGCAPGYVNTTKAQGDRELQEIINSNPDYYKIWAEEAGR